MIPRFVGPLEATSEGREFLQVSDASVPRCDVFSMDGLVWFVFALVRVVDADETSSESAAENFGFEVVLKPVFDATSEDVDNWEFDWFETAFDCFGVVEAFTIDVGEKVNHRGGIDAEPVVEFVDEEGERVSADGFVDFVLIRNECAVF